MTNVLSDFFISSGYVSLHSYSGPNRTSAKLSHCVLIYSISYCFHKFSRSPPMYSSQRIFLFSKLRLLSDVTNSQKRDMLFSYRRVIRPEKGPISLYNRYNVSNKPILPAVQEQFLHFLNFSGLKQPYAKQCA